VSDVSGAAVWTVDTTMEVCAAGATGINFHQVGQRGSLGPGGTPRAQSVPRRLSSLATNYSAPSPHNAAHTSRPAPYLGPPCHPSPRQVTSGSVHANANYNGLYAARDGRVRVRMPYYGYLLTQQALAGGATIVSRGVAGECKAWTLKGDRAGDLRVLVLNKKNATDCGVDLKMNAEQAARFADTAAVDYLYAGGGLTERWVPVGGQGLGSCPPARRRCWCGKGRGGGPPLLRRLHQNPTPTTRPPPPPPPKNHPPPQVAAVLLRHDV
jgi:hypothetical protein